MLPGFSDVEIERVVRRVATDSAGLPLLAVELLRAVALGLDLRGTAGAWPEPYKTLDQTMPGDLPDTVLAAIRVGFRRLSPARNGPWRPRRSWAIGSLSICWLECWTFRKARWRRRSMSWSGTGGWSTTLGATPSWPDW